MSYKIRYSYINGWTSSLVRRNVKWIEVVLSDVISVLFLPDEWDHSIIETMEQRLGEQL